MDGVSFHYALDGVPNRNVKRAYPWPMFSWIETTGSALCSTKLRYENFPLKTNWKDKIKRGYFPQSMESRERAPPFIICLICLYSILCYALLYNTIQFNSFQMFRASLYRLCETSTSAMFYSSGTLYKKKNYLGTDSDWKWN